jgi:transforming growth factor-beta-induced protein
MLELLQLSGLADEIEERQVTILAPSEEAFGKLSRDEVTDLLANPTKIDDILKRHIIDEVLTFDELSTKTEVNTLSGETLVVSAENGSVTVGGAMVSTPSDESVSGEGGQELAVLGIDRVLLDSQ